MKGAGNQKEVRENGKQYIGVFKDDINKGESYEKYENII